MEKTFRVIVTLPPVKFDVVAKNEEQVRERLLNNEYGYEIQEATDAAWVKVLEDENAFDESICVLEWNNGRKV